MSDSTTAALGSLLLISCVIYLTWKWVESVEKEASEERKQYKELYERFVLATEKQAGIIPEDVK
jgi:hypothetical protein